MGVAQINQWVGERLMTGSGVWVDGIFCGIPDVMFCIFEALSNRCTARDLETAEEYQRLVEVACDYLKENPNSRESKKLIEMVREDNDRQLRIGTSIKVKVIFERCLRTVLVNFPS